MNRFVLDTSVIVKWFSTIDEVDTKSALWLRQGLYENTCQIIIPDLALYELSNALRYNPNFTVEDVTAAIYSLVEMGLTIRAVAPDILVRAIELAYQYDVTLYDAYFLAIAAKTEVMLVTADYKFYQRVGETKFVVRLAELLKEGQEANRF